MSWDELLGIVQLARAEQEQARATPPAACPCGWPLQTVPETGELRCPADGWKWDGGPVDW